MLVYKVYALTFFMKLFKHKVRDFILDTRTWFYKNILRKPRLYYIKQNAYPPGFFKVEKTNLDQFYKIRRWNIDLFYILQTRLFKIRKQLGLAPR